VDPENGPQHDDSNLPGPTLWPVGFAIGIVVVLVGLIVDPLVVSSIGAAIAIVFGALWAREATSELRSHAAPVEPERREPVDAAAPPATAGEPAAALDSGERFPRNKFLEGATLGLGAVIGGPVTDLAEGQWYIATFVTDPAEVETSRRTAFVRNNGSVAVNGKQEPSFTIISNRCAHLGCPVQANGPTGAILGQKNVVEHTVNGKILLRPALPAGFGCPCHGGQYDTEGNRTAGPPVRGLDRYGFEIKNGHLILLGTFSVSHVVGTGAQAKIYKYKQAGPGEHIDGWEQILYPLQPPHH
jgi:Rieske Fe-S protein